MPVARTRRTLLLCAAALAPGLVLGCSKGNENSNAGATTAAAPAAAPTAGASTGASTGATATAGGEVTANPGISSWSDTNIVAHMAAGDSGEVKLARLAETKAVIPAVKDYAKMLQTDHSKGEKDVSALAKKAKLTGKPASSDTSDKATQDFYKRMTSMAKGKDWDSTWVKHEYDDHQQDIADAKAMQSQAKDAQLKQQLGDELPVLQKHLDAAAKLLGNTPGGTAAWNNEEFRKTQGKESGKKK